MIHAATNFSHQVAYRKADHHSLVTDGIYRQALQSLVELTLIPLKLVAASFLYWFLLLGTWDATRAAEPSLFYPLWTNSLEILLLSSER